MKTSVVPKQASPYAWYSRYVGIQFKVLAEIQTGYLVDTTQLSGFNRFRGYGYSPIGHTEFIDYEDTIDD